MAHVPFPGAQSPAAGFDQPFEMLSACHDRVRRSLALLQRLDLHVKRTGVDGQAQDAARDVLRYFSVAAPAHHADEELHVVPALMASGEPQALATATQLLSDHVQIRAAWARLEPLLQGVVDGQPPSEDFSPAAQRFCEIHEDHLTLEEGIAFPRAEEHLRALGPRARAAMGDEMAARRGGSPR